MYEYVCITLLCIRKTVSQLHFNNIYILKEKKKLVKNQRLVATKSCAKTSNHWHPGGLGRKCSALLAMRWAISWSPGPLANQRERWEEKVSLMTCLTFRLEIPLMGVHGVLGLCAGAATAIFEDPAQLLFSLGNFSWLCSHSFLCNPQGFVLPCNYFSPLARARS